MKPVLFVLVAAGTLLVATNAASAHEEIEPATITISAPHFLTLTAANETGADLNSVTITAPEGAELGETTKPPAGWTAEASAESVTFTGGAVPPSTFEEFGFELEPVDQPGTLTFAVSLGFSDGDSENVDVAVEAVVSGTEPVTTTTPPTTASSTTETTASSTTSEASTTTAAAGGGDDEEEGGDDSTAVSYAAGVVGLVALIVAIIALTATRRTVARRPVAASPGPGEDW